MSSRDKILARRTQFIAAALCGLSAASCGSQAEVCLSMVASEDSGSGDAAKDGSTDTRDTEPQACLTAPYDSGSDDTTMGDTTIDSTGETAVDSTVTDAEKDTGPMPCLAPPPS